MRNRLFLAVVAALLLCVASPVTAQPSPSAGADSAPDASASGQRVEAPARPPVPWSIDAVAGSITSGPTDDLFDAMRASGFDDRLCWLGCVDFPSQTSSNSRHNLPFWVAARHRLGKGRIHLGLAAGATGLGEVRGRRALGSTGPQLDVVLSTEESRVAVYAAMAWLEVVPGIRIGAGPSVNQATVRFDEDHALVAGPPPSYTFRKTNVGYVAEIGLTIPSATRLYFATVVQYRRSGSVTVSGWARTLDSGADYSFAPTTVWMDHRFFGIGVGGRF
jgi:hypothetical protein